MIQYIKNVMDPSERARLENAQADIQAISNIVGSPIVAEPISGDIPIEGQPIELTLLEKTALLAENLELLAEVIAL